MCWLLPPSPLSGDLVSASGPVLQAAIAARVGVLDFKGAQGMSDVGRQSARAKGAEEKLRVCV